MFCVEENQWGRKKEVLEIGEGNGSSRLGWELSEESGLSGPDQMAGQGEKSSLDKGSLSLHLHLHRRLQQRVVPWSPLQSSARLAVFFFR